MQTTWFIQILGWILLIGGIILVVIALVSSLQNSGSDLEQTKSRGIILIGPIPIVWGYGRKGWIIAGAIGLVLLLVWLLFFL